MWPSASQFRHYTRNRSSWNALKKTSTSYLLSKKPSLEFEHMGPDMTCIKRSRVVSHLSDRLVCTRRATLRNDKFSYRSRDAINRYECFPISIARGDKLICGLSLHSVAHHVNTNRFPVHWYDPKIMLDFDIIRSTAYTMDENPFDF